MALLYCRQHHAAVPVVFKASKKLLRLPPSLLLKLPRFQFFYIFMFFVRLALRPVPSSSWAIRRQNILSPTSRSQKNNHTEHQTTQSKPPSFASGLYYKNTKRTTAWVLQSTTDSVTINLRCWCWAL